MANLGIPQNTIEILQKYHFNFQKKYGQNFLIDTGVLDGLLRRRKLRRRTVCWKSSPESVP